MPTSSQPALIGWPLLPLPDGSGRITYPTLEESVRQSIRIILSTQPGEQLMRPTFGAGLQRYLHQQNTVTTRRRIRDQVTESLEQWERRIILEKVEVWEVPDLASHIRVEIAYRVKRNGTSHQLGFTLVTEP
jgi:uncharacterized protein